MMPVGDNYYQQLLNGGFIAKLSVHGREDISQKIIIVSDAKDTRGRMADSTIKTNFISKYLFLLSMIIIFIVNNRR